MGVGVGMGVDVGVGVGVGVVCPVSIIKTLLGEKVCTSTR